MILQKFLKNFAGTHGARPYIPGFDGKMHILEARRGRGKSYALTVLIYKITVSKKKDWFSQYPFRVVVNFGINKERFARMLLKDGHFPSFLKARLFVEQLIINAKTIDDYLLAYNSLVVMDECNRVFNAYKLGKERMGEVVHDWLQQSRKNKLTLWFACQYAEWVDIKARMLFDLMHRGKVVRHQDKATGELIPEEFWYYGSDPFANGAGSEIVRRADFKFNFKFDMRYARMYDSWEAIITVDQNTNFRDFYEVVQYQIANGLRPSNERGYNIWADAIPQIADLERALGGQSSGASGPRSGPTHVRSGIDGLPISWPGYVLAAD